MPHPLNRPRENLAPYPVAGRAARLLARLSPARDWSELRSGSSPGPWAEELHPSQVPALADEILADEPGLGWPDMAAPRRRWYRRLTTRESVLVAAGGASASAAWLAAWLVF